MQYPNIEDLRKQDSSLMDDEDLEDCYGLEDYEIFESKRIKECVLRAKEAYIKLQTDTNEVTELKVW